VSICRRRRLAQPRARPEPSGCGRRCRHTYRSGGNSSRKAVKPGRANAVALTAFKVWAGLRYVPFERAAEPGEGAADRARFFQPMTPEQVALAEQMVNALPANTDGPENSDGNSSGNAAAPSSSPS